MHRVICLGRRFYWILLPLFFSCCTKPYCPWELHYTKGCHSSYYSKQLLFARQSGFDVVDIEFLENESGLRIFMNLHVCPIECDPDGYAEVTCTIDENITIHKVHVLEGGQRLLIGDELGCLIVSSLNTERDVQLHIGMYSICVPSANFPLLWPKMNLSSL